MPWTTAMVNMDLEANESGTTISTKMTVEGVNGFFQRLESIAYDRFAICPRKWLTSK